MSEEAARKSVDDERLVHRLEAFSDIVIGFCIAEAAFSLAVPRSAAEFAHLGARIAPFGLTFLIVVLVWWLHNRLFAKLFVVTPVTIVANFAMLGLLALAVYFFQAFAALSNGSTALTISAARWWFASFGGVYVLLTLMYGIGMQAKWDGLNDDDRRFGVSTGLRIGLGGAFFLFLAWQIANLRGTAFPVALAVFVAAAVATRLIVPRVVNREGAAASPSE